MSVQDIIETKLPAKVQANPSVATSVNAKVGFDIAGDDGGQWTIDLTNTEGCVSSGVCDDAHVTLSMTDENFIAMIAGDLNPQKAFLLGKLKVKGDMGAALKLGKLLG